MMEPNCFLRDRICAATRNISFGKSDVYVLADAAKRGLKMGLRPPLQQHVAFIIYIFIKGLVHRCCSSVRLFVCLSVAKMQKNAIFSKTKQFRGMVSIDDL